MTTAPLRNQSFQKKGTPPIPGGKPLERSSSTNTSATTKTFVNPSRVAKQPKPVQLELFDD